MLAEGRGGWEGGGRGDGVGMSTVAQARQVISSYNNHLSSARALPGYCQHALFCSSLLCPAAQSDSLPALRCPLQQPNITSLPHCPVLPQQKQRHCYACKHRHALLPSLVLLPEITASSSPPLPLSPPSAYCLSIYCTLVTSPRHYRILLLSYSSCRTANTPANCRCACAVISMLLLQYL